ncbi:dihydroorotate dehydrogenase electron transfer subunit [Zymobacter sp. IVIA_5232.4 C2]|uniref:dihydroorotate dehydrogenase electron transfer subunit n=1 Tax=Zymobacter sp. IVIA_5232.4 C2 TaxID=3394855 RepID=UPI0039C23E1A
MLTLRSPHDDGTALILRNEWVNGDYKHMVVKASHAACQAQPGQFFTLLCPAEGSMAPFFRRPMSTYGADPHRGEVEFLYKVTGKGTLALSRLQTGDSLDILGPLGKGFRLQPDWQHIVIVARGVGLATLAPLAEAAHAHRIAMTVILSARSQHALLAPSQQRFERLGARVLTALDDGTSQLDVIEQMLCDIIVQHAPDALFTCGSKRLTALLKRLAAEYGIAGQVAMEEQMVCGLGMCQCCTKVFEHDGKHISRRVCVEGPVFDLSEVVA